MKRIFSILLAVTLSIPQFAFPAASLMAPANPQFFNNSGTPCNACKLYFYETESDTAKDTWVDSTQAVTNSNPITLNSRGESANGIFMNGTYRVVLKTSAGSQLWQRDGITGISDAALTAVISRWQASGKTPTYVAGTQFSTAGDNTSVFPVGRRLEITDATTLYGRITASSYNGSLTTVTVSLDSGSLSTSISEISYSLETPTNTSLSYNMLSSGSADLTIAGTSTYSGTNTFSGTTLFSTGATSFNVSTGTAPFAVASTTKVSNLNADSLDNMNTATASTASTVAARDSSGDLTSRVLKSDVTTGTSPITVSSTTKVTNLNADLLDDKNTASASTASTIATRDASGNLTANVLVSDVAIGTAPLTVTSTTKVTNLNADQLDSLTTGNSSGNIPTSNGTVNTNLNSDMLEGFHASATPGANQIPVFDAGGDFTIGSDEAINVSRNSGVMTFGSGRSYSHFGGMSTGRLNANLYYDGTDFRYIQNSWATGILVSRAETSPYWYTAPTGTAGEVATLSLSKIWHEGNDGASSGLHADALDDGTSKIHIKRVAIGDWDMDATNGVNVAHGLTASKIIAASYYIVDDSSTSYHQSGVDVLSSGTVDLTVPYWSTTYIVVNRRIGGYFDANASYNATSFNRGYITIIYTE